MSDPVDEKSGVLNIVEIFKLLPHRYPFLLVDRVLEIIPNKSIKGIKNVSINEAFFNGHFPGKPVMPGVLLIEALAQIGAILAYKSTDWTLDNSVFFMATIENARFKRVVLPGDQLILDVEVVKRRSTAWKFKGVVTLSTGEFVCGGNVTSVKGTY